MRKYLSYSKIGFQSSFAYSGWYWASLFNDVFRIVVVYFFWSAIFAGSGGEVGGMTLPMMTTYLVVSTACGSMLSFNTGGYLARTIYDGSIAVEFTKPYSLPLKIISIVWGENLLNFFNSFLVSIAIGIIFFGIQLPASFLAGALFLLSLILSIILMHLIDLCIGVIAFWTRNWWGLRQLRYTLVSLFSGSLLPLALFPGWFQKIAGFLPFKWTFHVPISIYLGTQPIDLSLLIIFALQMAWIVAFAGLFLIIWKRARRVVTVSGG